MSEELREALSRFISVRMSSLELVEDLRRRALRKGATKSLFGRDGIYRPTDLIEVRHPILRRREFFDWGNLTNRLKKGIDARVIEAALAGDLNSAIRSAEDLLDRVREEALGLLLERVEEGDDIRPVMMPGSVGRGEVPNLYLAEESYSRADRTKLALQLVRSVVVGRWASIYFEGDFQDFLEDLVRRKLDKSHIEASDLEASEREMDQPFVTLLRLLLWVYEQLAGEPEDGARALEELKSSSGVIYFVPKDSERYNAFHFPRLGEFVETWLQEDRRRKALKCLLNSIASLSRYRAAETKLELLYHDLNLLAHSLIETSSVSWEPLRRIVDSLIDLFDKQDLRVDLSFVGKLSEGYECSQ